MAKRGVSVALVQEIQRLIDEGLSDRKIARALSCRRLRVAEIRAMGPAAQPAFVSAVMTPPAPQEPLWATTVPWEAVIDEIGQGFELKRIWEERAATLTGYPNFWKYLSRRYPAALRGSVAIREFEPGSQCEVDWAGTTIPWRDPGGHRRAAHVFIGTLCHSQLIFACAFENEKKESWIAGHVKLFAFFQGVPRVTAPDNLKAGVTRPHLYDPDLNPAYTELATHYGTAVVPARVRRPKDKALGELAVKLVTRLFAWTFRHRRFTSLAEINEALAEVCLRINSKPHSRFKISRRERFEAAERACLKPLPTTPFEQVEWKTARVHPDSTVSADAATYSVPHIHRGKEVRVKLTRTQVEVFLDLARIALHARDRSHTGRRVIDSTHLPPKAQAYRETTPQHLLSQARFVSAHFHGLIEELFQEDALAHLRRAQGLIRRARAEIDASGRTTAEPMIKTAIEQMRRFGHIRVSVFDSQLTTLRRRNARPAPDREITRIPGNPMLRHEARTAAASGSTTPSLPN